MLAIGSPFGFDHSVTSGIISAKGRDNNRSSGADRRTRGLQRFLQTDAAINPGNSGGPLVNMAGEVIGVNTAIVSETNSFAGLGFALPSNTAVKVYNQLSQNGKITRGSIGIPYHSTRDPTKLEAYGVKGPEAIIVRQIVDPGSPAEKAGLQKHDVITEIDGMKMATVINSRTTSWTARWAAPYVWVTFVKARAQTATVTIGDRATCCPSLHQRESPRIAPTPRGADRKRFLKPSGNHRGTDPGSR